MWEMTFSGGSSFSHPCCQTLAGVSLPEEQKNRGIQTAGRTWRAQPKKVGGVVGDPVRGVGTAPEL